MILAFDMVLAWTGCGKKEEKRKEIDVDLTKLSSSMVYSEVYNMMNEPEPYEGKMVKMQGQLVN